MRRLQRLTPLLSVALLAGAFWVLHRELAAHHPRDIARAIAALPTRTVLGAIGLTALCYLVLPLYDALGLRYVGRTLGARRTMLAGFTAYAFSQTLGFSWLTGGSIRFRLYSGWGISAAEIGQLIAFTSLTFWLGAQTACGGALVTGSRVVLATIPLPIAVTRLAGIAMLALSLGYLLVCALRRRAFTVGGWEIPVPAPRLAVAQLLLGTVDWTLAATVLWILLPEGSHAPFAAFVGVFVIAQIAGVVSHVPGGLGVFEGLVLLLLKGDVPAASIVGSLVMYRVVYYLLPFVVAATGLATYELRERRAAVSRVAQAAARWLPPLVPRAIAITTFAGGAILLYSGALPAEGSRLGWLGDLLPLSVIELSHFVGSLVGVGLLILAWGIWNRLDGAFHAAVILLAAGIGASLLKGLDYEEAVLLSLILLALMSARTQFSRHASLLHVPFSAGWMVAVGTVVVTSFWLGLFAFRHVPYRTDLWWHFALTGDAPRFLRATVGAVAGTSAFALVRLLRAAPVRVAASTPSELERIAPALALAQRTYPSLVFLGDKSLLTNVDGTAFVMYGVSGRSWVAMGDPVGAPADTPALVWDFRELVDRHDGYTVFYQAAPEQLPLYLDLGLRPLKIGEDAVVPLAEFSLEGGSRRGLRRTKRQVEKEGCNFTVLPAAEVPAILPQCHAISDAWLASKETREKKFSLGRFDPGYLARFPAAIVRQGGRVVAFANVWTTAGRTELSIDLMRYTADAPESVMEYLFIELMLWGREQGYGNFSLGMAPLSGLESRSLAPLWNRMNALVFRHGEHFYHFQGLRQYKEKFDPEWSPRYLVAPGGLALPRVIADVAALISGGLRGVVAR
jgi:phosphatidylglycerol lysyltransferase